MVNLGQDYSAAIRIDRGLFTWGLNNAGQLGSGTTVNRSSPVQIGTSSWAMVSTGGSVVGAITSTGGLYTWGDNSNGAMADGTTVNKSSPVHIGTSSWSSVGMGIFFGAGILSTGLLFNWGYNFFGEIGNNTGNSYSSPVQIGTNTWLQLNFQNSSSGFLNVGAIRSDGTLWSWGGTSPGDGTSNTYSSPVQIGIYNPLSWTAISTKGATSLGIATSGLYTWGLNASGQLGDGTTIDKSSPIQIGTSSWSKVSTGNSNSVAITTTGALYTWGYNGQGQLGDGTTIDKSSPVQIGTSSWTLVSGGADGHSIAIRNDFTLWAWGQDNFSQLGDLQVVSKSSPVAAFLVQTLTSSLSPAVVVAGLNHSALIVPDSNNNPNLYTWGLNTSGQLGNGTTLATTSPTSPVYTYKYVKNLFAGGNYTFKQ
jgi:alpha-tubulin suppressor-like RCC1 family protein